LDLTGCEKMNVRINIVRTLDHNRDMISVQMAN